MPASPDNDRPAASGHYRIGTEIARGGMGSVLEAEDLALERKVAIKRILLNREGSDQVRARFMREACILARLEHPNIVPIHALGCDEEDRLFYVMKMVRGRTLQSIINDLKEGVADTVSEFPLPQLLTIFVKVCDAIAFAHAHGIIHRDLKPENIMVGAYGEVLVMDWGLAKMTVEGSGLASSQDRIDPSASPFPGQAIMDDFLASDPGSSGPDLTMEGEIMGSPFYMSPEQAEGRISDVNELSDVFSLGAVLYSILTLRPPVAGRNVREVLQNVREGNVISPTEFNTKRTTDRSTTPSTSSAVRIPLPHLNGIKIPGQLSAVSMRALETDVEDRHQSVSELIADVNAYQTGFATSVDNIGPLGQLGLWCRRNRAISLTLAASVCLTIAFICWIIAERNKADAAKTMAVSARERADEKELAARTALAQSQIAQADLALDKKEWITAQGILDRVDPVFRDLTWDYLRRKSDNSVATLDSYNGPVCPHPTIPGVFGFLVNGGDFSLQRPSTGETIATIRKVGMGQTAISPNGDLLALLRVSRSSFTFAVRDIESGRLLSEGANSERAVGPSHCSFDQSGRSLMVAGTDWIEAFDTRTAKPLWRWRSNLPGGRVHLNSTGAPLLHARDRIRFISPMTGAVLRSFDAQEEGVRGLAMHLDGSQIIVQDDLGTVRGFDARSGELQFMAFVGQSTHQSLILLPDDQHFALIPVPETAEGSYVIQIRSVRDGTLLKELSGARMAFKRPPSITAHPLTGEIVSVGSSTKLWSTRSLRLPLTETAIQSKANRFHIRPRNTFVFLGNNRILYRAKANLRANYLRLSPPATAPVPLEPFTPSGLDALIDLSPDRSILLLESSGSAGRNSWQSDRSLALFKRSGTGWIPVTTNSAYRANNLPTRIRLAPDGDRVLLATETQGWIHSMKSGKMVTPLQPPANRSGRLISEAWWLGDGSRIATIAVENGKRGTEDSTEKLIVWDSTNGTILHSKTYPGALDALTVSPDGARMAVAGADRNIQIWDINRFEILHEFRAHDALVTAMVWHPSLPIVASGSRDRSIRFWDTSSATLLGELHGVPADPVEMAFSPDGSKFAVATDRPEQQLRVWEITGLLATAKSSEPTRLAVWLQDGEMLKDLPNPIGTPLAQTFKSPAPSSQP